MLDHCILLLRSILPWSYLMANPGCAARSILLLSSIDPHHKVLISHTMRFYHILSIEFCDFDPLHDQVVVACEVFIALPTNFVADVHPIMSICL
jgi:hypothetical protein